MPKFGTQYLGRIQRLPDANNAHRVASIGYIIDEHGVPLEGNKFPSAWLPLEECDSPLELGMEVSFTLTNANYPNLEIYGAVGARETGRSRTEREHRCDACALDLRTGRSTGRMICEVCRGKGTVSLVDDDGFSYDVTCRGCLGVGSSRCTKCHGTGRI
jgi:hypothetical protein